MLHDESIYFIVIVVFPDIINKQRVFKKFLGVEVRLCDNIFIKG